MPLVTDAAQIPPALAEEIGWRMREHSPRGDSIFYNGGTVVALLLTGAAAVLAQVEPVTASALSASAAFVIAVSRALNFGGRWHWHLQRRNEYNKLAYRLNKAALLPDAERGKAYWQLFDELERQRGLDSAIPGSGEPVTPQDDTEVSEPPSQSRPAAG